MDPCANGGTCIELAVGYRCSCLKGFVGKNCEGRKERVDAV